MVPAEVISRQSLMEMKKTSQKREGGIPAWGTQWKQEDNGEEEKKEKEHGRGGGIRRRGISGVEREGRVINK